ncbi:MAG TPA: GNAT family N-acetyltransferase [Streptosporangiaceae bacterium]|nr:GNAT family N-acetyltransferase [Streptosporangiaceae bacterium]
MDIDIRHAEAADVPGLVALCAALFAEDGAARDRLRNAAWPQDNGHGWIEGLLAAPDALVLVAADRAGTAVGHLIGQFHAVSAMWTGARTELVSTYVVPGLRGRNIGGRLVEAFFAWSRERGAKRFHVSAYAANEPAIRFYRRYGFAPLSVELAADAQPGGFVH